MLRRNTLNCSDSPPYSALSRGQLTLQTLPDLLFTNNNGVHNVGVGSVIRLRCTASSSSVPTVTWFNDGAHLLNDPPHIRIRSSVGGNTISSVLIVDNFNVNDNGEYHCQASSGSSSMNSTILSFTSESHIIQCNLSIPDTLGGQKNVLNRIVSSFQSSI